MSLPQLQHTTYTIEDWKTWDGRWELIHGVPYAMTPAPTPDHQRVSVRLVAQIHRVLDEAKRQSGGNCEVFHAPIDLYLPDEQSVYQPDLLIVCDPSKITERGIEGVPDLVVEILSPGTAGKDVTRKRWSYEAAGIPEYLIVDPTVRVGVLLRLEDGRYVEAARIEWGAVMALLGGRVQVTLD